MARSSDAGEAPAAEPNVVPRWEWRSFAERFDKVDERLATLEPLTVRDSDELYVLSLNSDASVKVRDGLMDVKHLLRVDDHGLQLWTPVLKTRFPLAFDDAAFVLTTLNAAVPSQSHGSYTLEAFESELLRQDPELRVVPVHKRRARYVVDGCMLEMTEVTAAGSSTRTVALESVDPQVVVSLLESLGLASRINVSVARGLKALVGFGAIRYAVIDVGTNSVKFHVGEVQVDGAIRKVVDRAEITRLGEGQAESGELAEAAIHRTVDTIATMADEAHRDGADEIIAVGTAGLRLAPNRAELVDAVLARSGITVDVISGEDECRLAYLAARSALPTAQGRLVVFDSGGGSSQFTFGQDNQVAERFSLDVGAVRVAERFGLAGAVSKETVDAALDAVAVDLDRLDGRPRPDAVIAIGGTSTNLAAVKHGLTRYDPDVVHGTILDLAEIDRQIEFYRTRTADERRQIAGLQPARSEVILGGACIVRTILAKLHHDSLTVSDRGLRHGVFIERFAR